MCSRRNSSIESHPEYYRTKNERRTEASGSEDEGGRGTRAGERGHIYRRERVPYPVLPSPGLFCSSRNPSRRSRYILLKYSNTGTPVRLFQHCVFLRLPASPPRPMNRKRIKSNGIFGDCTPVELLVL